MRTRQHLPNFSGTLIPTLAEKVGVTALDVGARGGFSSDLLPISSAVHAYGFEPDPTECERLTKYVEANPHPWKSLQYLPYALGAESEPKTLNIYQRSGCSSLLKANRDLAREFGREDYYVEVDKAMIALDPLDSILSNHSIQDASFLKIDIQGYEMEAFRGASDLLNGPLVAIRAEVSFVPIYFEQPLFSDVTAYLSSFGFVPVDFLELHHWRRLTTKKYGRVDRNPVAASRGELVHGDVLYLKSPKSLGDVTASHIRLALIALCYGQIDFADFVLKQPEIAKYLNDKHSIDCQLLTRQGSQAYRRVSRRDRIDIIRRECRDFVADILIT